MIFCWKNVFWLFIYFMRTLLYFSVNCALFLFWTLPWEGTHRQTVWWLGFLWNCRGVVLLPNECWKTGSVVLVWYTTLSRVRPTTRKISPRLMWSDEVFCNLTYNCRNNVLAFFLCLFEYIWPKPACLSGKDNGRSLTVIWQKGSQCRSKRKDKSNSYFYRNSSVRFDI